MAQIVPTNWTEMKYFGPQEFACKCCGVSAMDHNFVLVLDKIRHNLGYPLRISSGYRCPSHNAHVSSTGLTGPHTTGFAADIAVSGFRAHEVLSQALMLDITGIGISQKGPHESRFIHLDSLPRGGNRPWVWSY